MIAQFLVHLCLGFAFASTVGYWYATILSNNVACTIARKIYYITLLILLTVSGILLHAFATNNFDFTYVQAYSSRQLSMPFLFAAMYSGQEGSFLLWAVLVSFVGIAVIEYSKAHNIEAPTMAFFTLVLLFLCTMLAAKNPFTYLWESFARDGTTRELVEALKGDPERYNGRGLNPVLQNYWILIHPPMLFSGFAAMSAPFAFSMAGLWLRRYQEWVRLAQPWILFSVFILGVGIALGGLWAYITLGWGGFWAWDPVENSSLIPWLFAVALLHTTIIQRRTNGLVRTNFILVTLSFITVLYSTFLTRSGVLGDTSVHSFVEPGYHVYLLLIGFLIFFLLISTGLLGTRLQDISRHVVQMGFFRPTSREFLLTLGALCIIFSSVVVLAGTSYPIVAEIIGRPKAAIEPSFYNQIHLPLITIIFLLNGLSLTALWSSTETRILLHATVRGVIIAVGATGILDILNIVPNPYTWIVSASAIFALYINVAHIVRLWRNRKLFAIGAFVSHAGLIILIIGILQYAYRSTNQHMRLIEREPLHALDYTFTLIGTKQLETHLRDREKYRYDIAVERGNIVRHAYPIVYYSDFNRRQAPFLEPGIVRFVDHDIYIAPKAIEMEDSSRTFTLVKNNPQVVFTSDSIWTIELLQFEMSHVQQSVQSGPVKLGISVRLSSRTGITIDTALYSYFDGSTFQPIHVQIPHAGFRLALINIQRNKNNPSLSTATINVIPLDSRNNPRHVLVIDASIKPMINLVWIGYLILLVGVFQSSVRSFRAQSRRRGEHILNAHQSGIVSRDIEEKKSDEIPTHISPTS